MDGMAVASIMAKTDLRYEPRHLYAAGPRGFRHPEEDGEGFREDLSSLVQGGAMFAAAYSFQ